MITTRQLLTVVLVQITLLSACFAETNGSRPPTDLYLVPNFHPGCMGWLARYSEERNYCLYSYLSHLDRVAKDPTYKFAFSEIPHLITMMEYEPARFEEFKRRVNQGRIECVNAFVLEPTVSLSGGEALVQQGVQGLRWYKQVLGLQPRYCWMIDTVGWHEQMAQIVSSLGLDAFVYCRYNPTGSKPLGPAYLGMHSDASAIHWIQSPDGTRALALCPGPYANPGFRVLFSSKTTVAPDALRKVIDKAGEYRDRVPAGAPVLILGGQGDYSLPFYYENYPAELIAAWNKDSPDLRLHIATPSDYLDAILPGLRAGRYNIPTVTGGSGTYGWTSFWMNAPIVKQWYRRAEHSLQAAEALATIASLNGARPYPAQEFANAWLLMSLNMDRNVLWGVMVDGSFRDAQSWDTCDRFEYVETKLTESNEAAFHTLTQPEPEAVTLFNPVNWTRQGPTELHLPQGRALAGIDCQLLEDGYTVLANVALPSMGLTSMKLEWAGLIPPTTTDLPGTIETSHYIAVINPDTGALISLKLKSSGREVLAGPSNVVLVETKGGPHSVPEKADRKLVASSSEFKPFISVTTGTLATIVQMRSAFHAGCELRRVIRFYNDSPRIDFLTETNGLPDGVILSVEFSLADEITEMRRGIPYGFSHGNCAKQIPGVAGLTKGILPAIRWSDYTFKTGGGVAILDRGVPARELVGNTPILLLQNVCDAYYERPVTWMADKGKQAYCYALVPHAQHWDEADTARMAWEYNCPVIAAVGRSILGRQSFLESSDNVIIEALRRQETEIELRLVECLGKGGQAWISDNLPHANAELTDLLGGHRQALPPGQPYTFSIRPQQIVTIRLRTHEVVPSVQAMRSFDSVTPLAKRDYMHNARNPKLIGHPRRKPK